MRPYQSVIIWPKKSVCWKLSWPKKSQFQLRWLGRNPTTTRNPWTKNSVGFRGVEKAFVDLWVWVGEEANTVRAERDALLFKIRNLNAALEDEAEKRKIAEVTVPLFLQFSVRISGVIFLFAHNFWIVRIVFPPMLMQLWQKEI